jgi:hypothetical protein
MRQLPKATLLFHGVTLLLFIGMVGILFAGGWLQTPPTWKSWFMCLSICWFALTLIVSRIAHIRQLPASASLLGRSSYSLGSGLLAIGMLMLAGGTLWYLVTQQAIGPWFITVQLSLCMLGIVSSVIGQLFLPALSGRSLATTTRTGWLQAIGAAGISALILFLIIVLWFTFT